MCFETKTRFDKFPRTTDINLEQSSHVETVVLLAKGEINSKKVRVEFSLEGMDMSGFQKGVTYEQIKSVSVGEYRSESLSPIHLTDKTQVRIECGTNL